MLDLRMRDGQLNFKGRLADKLDRISARRADALTAPSELIVHTLRRYAWLAEQSEVSVIPLPFDSTPFERVAAPVHTAATVLAVGRLEWRKGPDTLLDAAALLQQQGVPVRVVLAGKAAGAIDGKAWDEWLRLRAQQLGVTCEFAGHVGAGELQALYDAARVVAVPSRFDNFPMAALEGMAAGRPIVATTTNGLAGLIAQSRSGTLVPPDDPRALADGLAPFLTDVGHAISVGARGRLGMAALEAKRIAKLRERVYLQAIARHRARAGGVAVPVVEAPPAESVTNGVQVGAPPSA
jgi:glycosyltransferase involved in cell wall biosynthesis